MCWASMSTASSSSMPGFKFARSSPRNSSKTAFFSGMANAALMRVRITDKLRPVRLVEETAFSRGVMTRGFLPRGSPATGCGGTLTKKGRLLGGAAGALVHLGVGLQAARHAPGEPVRRIRVRVAPRLPRRADPQFAAGLHTHLMPAGSHRPPLLVQSGLPAPAPPHTVLRKPVPRLVPVDSVFQVLVILAILVRPDVLGRVTAGVQQCPHGLDMLMPSHAWLDVRQRPHECLPPCLLFGVSLRCGGG